MVGRTSCDAATPGLSFVAADLSSLAAARRVAQDLSASSLDILVFTNGVMAGRQRRETSEGIEYDLAVSYLTRTCNTIRSCVAIWLSGSRLSNTKPA